MTRVTNLARVGRSRFAASCSVLLLLAAGCATFTANSGGRTAKGRIRAGEATEAQTARRSTRAVTVDVEDRTHLQATPVTLRNVYERGYELGRDSTSEVGRPILKQRTYSTRDRIIRGVFSRSFVATCRSGSLFSQAQEGPCGSMPLAELRAEQGEAWTVAGILSEPGLDQVYYVIGKNVEGGILYVAVDEGGYLKSGQNVAWRADDGDPYEQSGLPLDYIRMDIALESAKQMVEFQHERGIVEGASHLNFDLLYAGRAQGTRTKAVRLLYKEYSPYITGREIHSEELVYRLYDDTIKFKKFRIRVHDADNQTISYRVESDAAQDG